MTKVYRIINTIWENNTSKIVSLLIINNQFRLFKNNNNNNNNIYIYIYILQQLNAQEIFDKIYEADEISDDSESIDESMIENLNETEKYVLLIQWI